MVADALGTLYYNAEEMNKFECMLSKEDAILHVLLVDNKIKWMK